ncbi:MAG TPA: radical SAM protein [Armatimonadota bacterium]
MPRLVFFETTSACNLRCVHCRAGRANESSPDDLSTKEAKSLVDQIASFCSPILVLSGGEPLVRPDIFEIASYAQERSLKTALATNGTLITADVARQITDSGISRVSVSIDAADAASHDAFRRVDGAFHSAWRGVDYLKEQQIPFQVNTTVARHNFARLQDVLDLAVERGAVALHLFLLVPTGCGKEIANDEMISPLEYEQVLNWLYDRSKDSSIGLKATCAPHYVRVNRERASAEGIESSSRHQSLDEMTKGCLAGSSVCFISHSGNVYPCGYLPITAGSVRSEHLRDIWENAEVFKILRNADNLHGKCRVCGYRRVCGGCRARAYGDTGDYLGEEPYCVYGTENR